MSWGAPVRAVGGCSCASCGAGLDPVQARVGECAPCAAGKKCSCTTPCPKKSATGACDCKKKAAAVGISFVEEAVPWDQVTVFDQTIRNYGTDVGRWAQDMSQWGTTTGAQVVKYKIAWDNFYTGWRVWFDVESEPTFFDDIFGLKVIAGEDLTLYKQKIVEYEEIYREGTKDLGIKTSALAEAPKPPIDIKQMAIDAANKLKAAGEGAAKAAEWGFYIVVAAGIGFAALLLYPVVAPLIGGAVSRARSA